MANEQLLQFRRRGHLAVVGEFMNADLMNKVNATMWHGKEPGTCMFRDCEQSEPLPTSGGKEADFIFTIAYRPKGIINFQDVQLGYRGFWWDGWKLKHIDMMRDGTLLDGKGKPLPLGAPPVVLEWDMYGEADFNAFDFGEQVA